MRRVADSLIAEVVHILNERLHLLPDGAFPRPSPLATHFISSKRLLQDGNQGTVPREKHRASFSEVSSAGCHIEPDQSFASTGYARYKDYRLLTDARGLVR